jgi:hypothetical protein
MPASAKRFVVHSRTLRVVQVANALV